MLILWGVVSMFISSGWQSKTALIMAFGMTSLAAIPALIAAPATAVVEPYIVGQTFPSERVTIPAGTVIPVELEKAEKIVVTPDETAPVTLLVATDIRTDTGTILIPEGSKIEGELRPVSTGTQFVAKALTLNNSNRRLPIGATSQVITEREIIKKGTDVGQILKGAAIGAAASAVLAEIFGSINVPEVLGGAGLGAIAGLLLGGNRQAEVIVVNPEEDLSLTLQSDLVL
ncbi:hypothetical protein [Allocoleopsis franciscana]|uniref:Bacterial conjugation TrbI-like protein n=1 Tax=Allocoleopsis franciscana PCC 7113 TaxID=1173027 RepID=K9WJZ2_9CYAN|nr:hypothetical protein [Allocoleopsis franciscana]AFZ20069.1 hypothetical protein Mic7113_4372 [Allocoleopsis franciscana PCC 7113]